MDNVFRGLFLVLVTVLVSVSIGNSILAATPEQQIIDARHESQIWTTYALSPYLRANNIKVSVVEGKATLTGTVEEEANKELAGAIAVGVDGIKDVDNKIDVKADYTPKIN